MVVDTAISIILPASARSARGFFKDAICSGVRSILVAKRRVGSLVDRAVPNSSSRDAGEIGDRAEVEQQQSGMVCRERSGFISYIHKAS